MRRLLVRYGLAMSSVVLLAFLVPLGLLARSLAEGRALDGARQDAQRVAVFAGGTSERSRLEAEVLAVNEGARKTTVFLADGTQVGAESPRDTAVELAALGRAFTAQADGGAEVLIPVVGAGGVAVVRTFVPDAELGAGVWETWLVLGGVGAVLLIGTVFAGDRIARRLARSTLDLSGVADRLGAGDLTARVTPSGPPEIVLVGRVLNGLGARVGQLLAAERELVADLSHRLRTPITALRLDVDLLEDAEERDRMSEHVDELVRAVDAVVWIARHPAEAAPSGGCDAGAVVAERARFWSVLAADQGRDLRVDVPGEKLQVAVSASDLGAGVDVLIDNVFSHTPEGAGFAITVRASDDLIEVVIADDGPGFQTLDLVERGRSGVGSTGLGMDVARRTAERAGGRLVIGSSAGGGARVALELPRA